jgi:RecA-family ATPase
VMSPLPSIQHIAAALGAGWKVHGKEARGPGPHHGAGDESLCVTINDAGDDIVVCSFAQDNAIECKDYVRQKAGLDVWQAKKNGRHGAAKANGNPGDELAAMVARATASMSAPAAQAEPIDFTPPKPKPTLVATYDYVDGDGVVVYQVQRFSDKNFSQRRSDGAGWCYTNVFEGVARIPYRLADINAHPDASVYVTEGEKDADNVAALGLCGTTVAGSVWTTDCTAPLAGRNVFILEDNDETGRKKSVAAALALHNIAKSIRIICFTDLPIKGDVTDWLAIDGNDKAALEALCASAPAWMPGAVLPPVATLAPVIEPLRFVDFSSWNVAEGAPEQEWGLEDKFAMQTVGLFSGEGGAGKSLLAMQLALAHPITNVFLGSGARSGAFLYLSAEDDRKEMQRRQTAILRSMDADFSALKGKMHLLDFVGEDSILGAPDNTGLIKPTKLFERLLAAAIEIQPVMICLDTSADIYAGNENDRAQVRQFLGMLRKLAMLANAYVLVNSHVSLTGISSGSGLSGSTAWHNTVRSRMYLSSVKTKEGDEPDVNLRRLEFKKNNYGPVASAVDLVWEKGIYRPVAPLGSLARMAVDQNADRTFLALLDRFNGQGVNVSHKKTSHNYAPKLFADEAEAKRAGLDKDHFVAAQRRLLEAKKIKAEPYGAPSKDWSRLVSS